MNSELDLSLILGLRRELACTTLVRHHLALHIVYS